MARTGSPFLATLTALVMTVALASTAVAGARPFHTTLLGANEVPGPGDAGGSGTAQLWLNHGQGRVCFELAVSGLSGTPVAAHIHAAPAGVAGPVVVGLTAPTTGASAGCITGVARSLIKAIIHDPTAYYVNVHTTDFPAGALRGQLSRSSTH